MNVAAQAVAEINASPPPKAPVRAPDGAEQSFAEHLEVEMAEEEPPADEDTLADCACAQDAAPAPDPSATNLPQAQLLLQLLGAPGSAATTEEGAEEPTIAAVAPASASTDNAPAPENVVGSKADAAATKSLGAEPPLAAPPALSSSAPTGTVANAVAPATHQGPATAQTDQPTSTAPTPTAAAPVSSQLAPPSTKTARSETEQASSSETARSKKGAVSDGKSVTTPSFTPPTTPADTKSSKVDAPAAFMGNEQSADANSAKANGAALSQPATAPPQPTINSAALAPAPMANLAHASHTLSSDRVQAKAPAATQVAREIIRRFDGESTRFELRLDPPELGRVDVKLEVSRDQRVTAIVAADSPQALAEFIRHARDLEQSLNAAGLQLTENGLTFDLRQGREGEAAEDEGPAGGPEDDVTEAAPPAGARPLGMEVWRGVRVDIRI